MTELGRNIHTYLNKGIVGINLTFFWSMVTSSFKLLGARLEKFFSFETQNQFKQVSCILCPPVFSLSIKFPSRHNIDNKGCQAQSQPKFNFG